MAQYRDGFVDVVNGSDMVAGSGTAWVVNARQGDLFNIRGELAIYAVIAVVGDGSLQISPAYAGTTKSLQPYNLTRDFTPNYGLYLPSSKDLDWAFLLSLQALAVMDTIMGDPTQMVGFHIGTDQPTDPRAKVWLVPGAGAVVNDNFPVFTAQPAVQSTAADGGVISYGTSDAEGDHYKVEVSTNNGTTYTQRVADEIPGSGKTISLTGLSSGSYQIKIRITALTGNTTPVVGNTVTLTVGTSNQAPVFTAQPAVQSTTNDGGVITYGTSDTEGDHHKTEISTNGGTSWSQVLADEAPGPGKTVTLVGLAAGQSYTVKMRITALTGNVTPVVSSGVVLTVPINASASFTSQPSVQSVANDGGVIAYGTSDAEGDHYKVEISTNNGTNYTVVAANETPGAGKTITLSGLASGQTYQVKVRLTPLTGNTTPTISNMVTLTTQAPPTFTSQPSVQSTNATGGVIAYGTADVNGDHYRLDVSTDGGATWTTGVVADQIPGSGKTVTLSGLATGTYSVKLRLTPLSGDTTQVVSNAVSMTVTTNQAPTFTAQPSISSVTSDGCVIAYGTSDPENDQYKVEVSSNNGISYGQQVAAEDPAAGKSITLTGLAEGSYTVLLRITALTGNTTPVVSNSVALTIDKTPSAFSFTSQTGVALGTDITSNSITVAGINAPSPISITGGTYSKNGAAYTSAAGTVANGDTITVRVTSSGSNSTTSSCTLTIGGVSGTFSVTTLVANQAPTAPTGLSAGSYLADGSGFTLSWNAASDPDGSVASYKIYRGGSLIYSGVTATSKAVTGQTAGGSGAWTVSAVDNSGAEGAPSSPLTVQLIAAPPVISVTPGDTQNVIALTSGGTGATSYNLKWGTSSGSRTNTITGVTLPYTHTGRTNGTAYYYSVVAVNASGSSESVEVSGTPGGAAALPNLSAMTKVEPTSMFAISSSGGTNNKLRVYNQARNETAYIYHDFGANHFADFEIRFRMMVESGGTGDAFPILLTNTLGDANGQEASLGVEIYYSGSTPHNRVYLDEGQLVYDEGTDSMVPRQVNTGSYYSFTSDAYYYYKIARHTSGGIGTATLTIYSDAFVTPVYSVSFPVAANTPYRYLLLGCSYNDGSALAMSYNLIDVNVVSP